MPIPFNRSRTLGRLVREHEKLVERPNPVDPRWYNGVYERFAHPVVTREHVPLFWRYDLDPATNPLLLERQGVNATFNSGAIELDGKILLVLRVEGCDRKSFFAVAESRTGIDNFRFWDHPVTMPETTDPDVNVYDMRLTRHEDGWIYGLFCTERRDPNAAASDTSSALAKCAISRTRDLVRWERLPDLVSRSPQQRNVVLHPEFVDGKKYGLYTRPMDEFTTTGSGGGIGWAVCDSMERAVIADETIMDPRVYHTIKEVKNGQGPAPFRTPAGWLHILHGVRNTAAGMRYTIYAYLADSADPANVIARPAGHLIAPLGWERVGDVANVVFTNGAVLRPDGVLLLYYASSDTRLHVARTSLDRMLDYVLNTPGDGLRSAESVRTRNVLIDRNLAWLDGSPVSGLKRTGH